MLTLVLIHQRRWSKVVGPQFDFYYTKLLHRISSVLILFNLFNSSQAQTNMIFYSDSCEKKGDKLTI